MRWSYCSSERISASWRAGARRCRTTVAATAGADTATRKARSAGRPQPMTHA